MHCWSRGKTTRKRCGGEPEDHSGHMQSAQSQRSHEYHEAQSCPPVPSALQREEYRTKAKRAESRPAWPWHSEWSPGVANTGIYFQTNWRFRECRQCLIASTTAWLQSAASTAKFHKWFHQLFLLATRDSDRMTGSSIVSLAAVTKSTEEALKVQTRSQEFMQYYYEVHYNIQQPQQN